MHFDYGFRMTACLLLAAYLQPCHAQTQLTAAEVRQLIVGNTATGTRPNGSQYQAFFDPSGKWIRNEGGQISEGTWRIKEDGAQCVAVSRDDSCAFIQKGSDDSYTRIVDGKVQFKWAKVVPGKAF